MLGTGKCGLAMLDWESLRFVYLRRVVGTALTALGLRRSMAVACALARGVHDLNTPGRRLAEQRLRTALGPTVSEGQRDAIVRTAYEHVARFWIETLFLPRRLSPHSWRHAVRIQSELPPSELSGLHPRCVLATCYFGNPAVATFALGQIFKPVHVLVDYLAQPAARTWLEQLTRMPNVRPLALSDGARQMRNVLRQRGAVMMVVEHRRQRGEGAATWFLGEHGVFQTTPGRLAAMFHAPVVPVLCRRRPGLFEFELWMGRPVFGDDPVATTIEVLRQLDAQVRQWPEQYIWMIPPNAERRAAADVRGRDLRGVIDTGSGRPAGRTAG